MQEYHEFIKRLVDSLSERMGERFEIRQVETEKNNGILLKGISIRDMQSVIAPTIYMQGFYDDYRKGAAYEDILDQILNLYENRKVRCNPDFSFFSDYNRVKPYLSVKLIHYEKNKNLLTKIPHRKVLDLAIACYCDLGGTPLGCASILIRNEHLKIWGIDEETLLEDSMRNVCVISPKKIMNLDEVIRKIVENMGRTIDLPPSEEMGKAYILTNTQQHHGAVALFYPDALKEIAEEIEDDFYILPSSVHEVILLPAFGIHSSGFLYDMVYEVNRTQVDPEEVLSDTVYYYDRETQEISIG